MILSIVLPTVQGREQHFDKALAAYTRHSRIPVEIIVIRDQPTCGRAWNLGALQATGDYIHFGADDVEPHDGWDVPAREVCDDGNIPSPMLYRADGCLYHADGEFAAPPPDGHVCRLNSYAPFCSAAQYEQIGPTIDAHYGTDDFFSWRAIQMGAQIILRHGYAFTHHFAEVRRGAGMSESDRHAHDTVVLQEAIARGTAFP